MADNQEQQQQPIPPPPPIHRYLAYKANLAQIAEAEAEAEAAKTRRLQRVLNSQQRRTAKRDRRPPGPLLRKFNRNERSLLASLAGVLWLGAWGIVCFAKKCSAYVFFHSNDRKLVVVLLSGIIMVYLILRISIYNYTLRIPSPILRIILTGGCCTFGLMGCEVVSDWLSAGAGLLLSLFTIPFCRLLKFNDNIGFFESSAGMSAAALLSDKCIGKSVSGWTAVFAYFTVTLFVKFKIGIWFQKNDIRKAAEEEEE